MSDRCWAWAWRWPQALAAGAAVLGLALPLAVLARAAADCDGPAPWRMLNPAMPLPGATPQQAVWLDAWALRWRGVSPEADSRFWLVASPSAGLKLRIGQPLGGVAQRLPLTVSPVGSGAPRLPHVAAGVELQLAAHHAGRRDAMWRGQLMLVELDGRQRLRRFSPTQLAAALDDRHAAAAAPWPLGAQPGPAGTRFAVWAPTAQRVWLCLHARPGAAAARLPMRRHAASGVWQLQHPADVRGARYRYLLDVLVPGTGLVRNRVTDPYALALDADSRHAVVVDLDDPALEPPGWDAHAAPATVQRPTDLVIYELHVRDFSIGDTSVPEAYRGKYAAFTQTASAGMRHLAALARAGLTDLHLLPVFDFATVPERGCRTPPAAELAALPPDSEAQQARVMAGAAQDCFNWGYDPLHYTVPEGSYASDADDPARRILEFRQMVMALHGIGLRVGMDVVYNHTSASGQHAQSVLDRIVPGYYHRLDAQGRVERSTCCENTATEHAMMGRLMLDSVLTWARAYRIDSFRFDLMGHQPKAVMLALQRRLREQAPGREIPLIGEGWNFGEVADGARFVQAAQRQLAGSGIASFSDRARDALRGRGGPRAQGWLNGLGFDRHPEAELPPEASAQALRQAADLVRVGLAGTLADYRLPDADGRARRLADIPYGDQPAGYAAEPGEVVNYVENHDNPTLWDNHVAKLPPRTSPEDRARVQLLGAAAVALSQGIAYFHAGQDILRSKSLDANSFDSGDWFNRLDWSYRDNGFGSGLPPAADNAAQWPLWRPLLADAALRPTPALIAWSRDAFQDLLRIRASSTLFRLPTAAEVQRRLRFHATGADQPAGVILASLDGEGWPGAGFREIVFGLNTDRRAQALSVPALAGRGFQLHPVQAAPQAADGRPREQARHEAASGRFELPPRSVVVWVRD